MRLTVFEASDFRNLTDIRFSPAPGLNLVSGPNGSGKSSLLEAIEVLAAGRSFRSRRVADHVRFGADAYSVRAEWYDPIEETAHRAGLRRSLDGRVELRMDYERQSAFLPVSRALPIKSIVPSNDDLIMGGPAIRRRFIDWGVFHVEPGFADAWHRFRRALAQRNAWLRSGSVAPAVGRGWDEELAVHGTSLDRYRSTYLTRLVERLRSLVQATAAPFEVNVEYQRGWSRDLSLAEALERQFELCFRHRTTSVGPHRADMVLRSQGQPARSVLSRGQSKTLAYLLHFAQLELLRELSGRHAVVLCDDPMSELDAFHVEHLVAALIQLELQAIVTATAADRLRGAADQCFSISRGTLSLAL